MSWRPALALAASSLLLTSSVSAGQSTPSSWLDRPLTNWNKAGSPVPPAPGGGAAAESVIRRCQLTPPRSTTAERAIDAAGWIPFWNVDQQLVREDVEIIAGMREADGMCRPATYNLFVFVGGRFAGVLSPMPMTSRLDSSSGVVRLALPGITAEFVRFASTDPLCCPSSRVTVRYRIDRTAAGPVVAPVEVRNTRP
jgi:hypothetical protein